MKGTGTRKPLSYEQKEQIYRLFKSGVVSPVLIEKIIGIQNASISYHLEQIFNKNDIYVLYYSKIRNKWVRLKHPVKNVHEFHMRVKNLREKLGRDIIVQPDVYQKNSYTRINSNPKRVYFSEYAQKAAALNLLELNVPKSKIIKSLKEAFGGHAKNAKEIVDNLIKKYGYSIRRHVQYREAEKIRKMLRAGIGEKKVAETLGLTLNMVRKHAPKRMPVTKDKEDYAVELYKKGYPIKTIEDKAGISSLTLYKTLDQRGIPRRVSKKANHTSQ